MPPTGLEHASIATSGAGTEVETSTTLDTEHPALAEQDPSSSGIQIPYKSAFAGDFEGCSF